jgi:hypothetical protein
VRGSYAASGAAADGSFGNAERDVVVTQHEGEERAHGPPAGASDEELLGEEIRDPLDVARHERVEVLVLGKLCSAR